jgi:hypothetical protein
LREFASRRLWRDLLDEPEGRRPDAVMFRLFRTMRPSLIYDRTTIYRHMVTGTDAIGLLGVEGPCWRPVPS